MAEKKTKAKAKAKANENERPAQLMLRDGTGVTLFEKRIVMFGNPDGIQMHGRGHRVTGNFEDRIMLESYTNNRKEVEQVYLDNGWTLSK